MSASRGTEPVPAATKSRAPTRRAVTVGLGGAAAALVTGCSGDRSPKTTALEYTIVTDETINLNEAGVPSPIVLRLYELKDTANFSAATFFELFDNDTARLGGDLVSKREIELKPNDKRTFERDTPLETRFIGVIAGFRQLDVAEWRTVAEVSVDRTNYVVVKVTALAVKMELTPRRSTFSLF
jgi:type VI secretion system protein VasD